MENKVDNWEKLKRILETMEPDEGVRIDLEDRFIFINKIKGEYPVCICEKVYDEDLKKYLPKEDKEWYSFQKLEELINFLKERVRGNLEAWIY
ncbi:hypothetical protein HRbin06_00042 [archaeon HR06]|nr:hypothetical protein HRbin06_00042 [archaeon HR06]